MTIFLNERQFILIMRVYISLDCGVKKKKKKKACSRTRSLVCVHLLQRIFVCVCARAAARVCVSVCKERKLETEKKTGTAK